MRSGSPVSFLGAAGHNTDQHGVRFWLGTHRPYWLALTDVPLFVSRRTLADRKTLPTARGYWALDSGGFTELSLYGYFRTSEDTYADEVERFAGEIGGLAWAAPQDWMCEPFMLAKTGLDVGEHQRRTLTNYLRLSDRLGTLVIPVLQGWAVDDYLRHVAMYERAGVDLPAAALVGVGSVCRRQHTTEAARIFRRLAAEGLSLHGFGVKVAGTSYADALVSADSMAWSAAARWDANHGQPSCEPRRRRSCANCLHYALIWRERRVMPRLNQLRLEVAA